jgi:hypothetical protein
MDINEFKKRLDELGRDAAKKQGEFISAQNKLFNEAKAVQNGFFDKSFMDKLDKKEKEWQEASNKFYDWLKYGDGIFNVKK